MTRERRAVGGRSGGHCWSSGDPGVIPHTRTGKGLTNTLINGPRAHVVRCHSTHNSWAASCHRTPWWTSPHGGGPSTLDLKVHLGLPRALLDAECGRQLERLFASPCPLFDTLPCAGRLSEAVATLEARLRRAGRRTPRSPPTTLQRAQLAPAGCIVCGGQLVVSRS